MSNRVNPVVILKSLRSLSTFRDVPSARMFCYKKLVPILGYCYRNTSIDLFPRTLVSFSSNTTPESFPSNQNLVSKNDADTFGSKRYETKESDEGDLIEEEFLTYLPSERMRIKQYADVIKDHLKNKKLSEAIDVLETRMLKVDRVKPDDYIYALVIGACGRAGYTKKAFQLYNQMKKRAIKVNGAVYTGLFNSCANSPFPVKAIELAKHLREIMNQKGIQPNTTHYNAMIKAFGRCGDVAEAFRIVDEMVDRDIHINSETFSFLLQSCVSDTEAGFRHAVLVWHKMIHRGYKPDVFLFNLLLRCVRDCGLGTISEAENTFQQLTAGGSSLIRSETTEDSSLRIAAGASAVPTCESELEEVEFTNVTSHARSDQLNHPNLLARVPRLGNIVAMSSVTEPHDRLLLLGGTSGFISCMQHFHVFPDIKTVTLLLECIPPTVSAEKALMAYMKRNKLKLDVPFCNALIKKRSFRLDYESARDVLRIISTEKLLPDIVTFGVLALSCRTIDDARLVIHDMNCAGYRVNEEILGAMLKQACCHYNFKYAMKILYLIKEEGIKPSTRFINIVDNFNEKCQEHIKTEIRGGAAASPDDTSFKKDIKKFYYKYKVWLNEMGGKETFKDPHPWEQFRKRAS